MSLFCSITPLTVDERKQQYMRRLEERARSHAGSEAVPSLPASEVETALAARGHGNAAPHPLREHRAEPCARSTSPCAVAQGNSPPAFPSPESMQTGTFPPPAGLRLRGGQWRRP